MAGMAKQQFAPRYLTAPALSRTCTLGQVFPWLDRLCLQQQAYACCLLSSLCAVLAAEVQVSPSVVRVSPSRARFARGSESYGHAQFAQLRVWSPEVFHRALSPLRARRAPH